MAADLPICHAVRACANGGRPGGDVCPLLLSRDGDPQAGGGRLLYHKIPLCICALDWPRLLAIAQLGMEAHACP